MKKSKMYVVMLLAVMVVSALVGCGMKNSNGEDMEATTGWSVEDPDNTKEIIKRQKIQMIQRIQEMALWVI